ncbi:hypothetical protein THIOM_000289 [Candidatus Thiomargarita nelsonii]|uniref:Uncharacterized protein n=1 Tax=Candidatus Thiomargarita nelsonii TaxID=1003181 RepID=A0A176S7H1_9GAMM|nr:hypothetical protein THIOM_000289 [Candidatus Thiomargarita nelsonii]
MWVKARVFQECKVRLALLMNDLIHIVPLPENEGNDNTQCSSFYRSQTLFGNDKKSSQ